MAMLADHYSTIKSVHIALVVTSGTLFACRGIAVFSRQAWPMRKTVRIASVTIDTLLLGAGAAMWFLLALHPLRDAWLGSKLLLLLLYIVLGAWALRRERKLALVAAIICYGFIISVALAHHPLGALQAFP